LVLVLCFAAVLVFGQWVAERLAPAEPSSLAEVDETPSPSGPSSLSELYVQKVGGLHVTGIPVPVRIEEYRLSVTGAVENTLALTFEQVKSMPSVTRFIVLECPGTFVDQGEWTGVPVGEILDLAVPAPGAYEAEFVSLDGSYSKRVPLAELDDSFLIAYLFDGSEFPEVHGYPLRLAAEGRPGNVWVKWLGEIRILFKED